MNPCHFCSREAVFAVECVCGEREMCERCARNLERVECPSEHMEALDSVLDPSGWAAGQARGREIEARNENIA